MKWTIGKDSASTIRRNASHAGRKYWIRSKLRPEYIVKQLAKQLLNSDSIFKKNKQKA